MKAYLEAGEFTTTHGIAGELRLYPWCDSPAFLRDFTTLYLDENGTAPLAASIRPHKNICIVKLYGVNSVEAARPFIGKTAWIARSDAALPPGAFFVQDLLGACVVDATTGEEYGVVQAILHPGRHDVYEVRRPWGDIDLFPAAPEFVAEICPEQKRIAVRPIAGMFEPQRPPAPKQGG